MLIYIAYVYSQFQVACPITKKNKNPKGPIKCKLRQNFTKYSKFDWSGWFFVSAIEQAT